MYKIAVMGDYDSIYGFAALGLDIVPVAEPFDPEAAGRKLREMAGKDYAVIYITESLAAVLEEEIDSYRMEKLPAIIPIPGVSGNNGMGIKMVKKSVEQAVGTDIVFQDKSRR